MLLEGRIIGKYKMKLKLFGQISLILEDDIIETAH